ncbi:hypothetical protein [Micrococcus yunnanensis]|uniref:hypothetical protein n=1 Tax=Micrococcus yunnanensis TaxID=566027 RepID=UPI0019F36278|nr:hypothetical protein [Micrococcus yunnanensis]MBE1539937.1 hypothetical protein [Micrococcus yunnanensis]
MPRPYRAPPPRPTTLARKRARRIARPSAQEEPAVDIMIAVAVGVFLLVAWTVGGWAIVRMGFTRDGDAARTPAHDDGAARPAHRGPAADPATDPHVI